MNFVPLLAHLRSEAAPLRVPRARPIVFADESTHRAAWSEDPELYALSALASGVAAAQRARALYVMLAASWVGLPAGARALVDRVVRVLVEGLPPDDVLTVFLALRRARANHKHASRAIVRFVLEHPRADELVRARRACVRDALEHAVGRDVARGAAVNVLAGRRFPHARDQARAAAILALLYGKIAHDRSPARRPPRVLAAPAALFEEVRLVPRTITATNRGDVSATLVHLYRGGEGAALREGLERFVAEAAARLPAFEGRIAVVLDASASMRGYGEREYCAISQAFALALVLERACREIVVVVAGGDGSSPPRPCGATDLAGAVLEAAESDPDVIAVVTDGYENLEAGDLADVAQALPGAGIDAPIVICQSKFTFKDDLALRRPAPRLEEIGFWHEDDFAAVLFTLASRTKHASAFLRRALEARLLELESELVK